MVPLAVLLLALGLYASTAAPTVTWRNGGADSGELVTASYTLGIAHPPGYPLYVLLGKAWSLLPLGEIAHRYSLFSAVCGALAAAVVALLAAHLCRRSLPPSERPASSGALATVPALLAGAAAGLALAAAPAVWAQATVPEVYTLDLALRAGAVGLLFRWSARQSSGGGVGPLVLAGLAVGLGLANHVTMAFLVPLGLGYAVSHGWRAVPARRWLAVATALLAGLAIYVYLPLRAAQQPLANWGDPSTLERWLRHVTAADYQGYLFGRPLAEVLLRVPVVARLLVEQFTWVGVALVLLGFWVAWDRLRREAALLLGLALAHTLFALVYNADGSQVYLLPAFLVAAVFLGLGAGWAWRLASLEAPRRWRRAAVWGVALLVLLTPVARAVTAYPAVDASTDRQALAYALERLEAAPAGAVLTTQRDEETFPLWYAQLVLGVHPEVPVIDVRLAPSPWYRERLARQYPGLVLGR